MGMMGGHIDGIYVTVFCLVVAGADRWRYLGGIWYIIVFIRLLETWCGRFGS